jgi:ketosteroid isomerase-like protein
MKRRVLTALLPVAIGALVSCARVADEPMPPAASTEGVEQAITQLENERVSALLKGDVAFIERVYADDYVVNSANGMTRNKTQVIADIKAGVQSFESMSHRNVRIRVYGDAAVVTGHTALKGQYKGQPSLSPTTFTRVYARLNGQWRLVANTSSVYTETE